MSGYGSYPPPGQPAPPPPGYPQPGQVPPGYPQPGQVQPGYPQPGHVPPGYSQPGYPRPPMPLPAAHKPGAIPLRPLGLGDMYDGAFKIIRFNPKATVGSAVMVTAVAMAIPLLVTVVMTLLVDLSGDLTFSDSSTTTTDLTTSDAVGLIVTYGSMIVGSILQAFGLIFVTGMVAHVTAAAAIGRKLSLAEAWAATRGKRWRLIGLAFLIGAAFALAFAVVAGVVVAVIVLLPGWIAALASVALVLTTLAAAVFFWVRVAYLAVPPLMLEPIGVFDALGRSWNLTRRQFWRTFGIALLTVVITQIIGGMIGVPFSIVGALGSVATTNVEIALLIMVATNALSSVVSAAFVSPFTSAVASLQYVDQRIRKEGYDVELLSRAGIAGP